LREISNTYIHFGVVCKLVSEVSALQTTYNLLLSASSPVYNQNSTLAYSNFQSSKVIEANCTLKGDRSTQFGYSFSIILDNGFAILYCINSFTNIED